MWGMHTCMNYSFTKGNIPCVGVSVRRLMFKYRSMSHMRSDFVNNCQPIRGINQVIDETKLKS